MRRFKIGLIIAVLLFFSTSLLSAQSVIRGRRRVTTYNVYVNSNVKGASIKVDGDLIKEKTPATLNLKSGEHTIEIMHPGYKDYSQKVSEETKVYAALERLQATFKLEIPAYRGTGKPSFQIYANGKRQSGYKFTLDPGKYTIMVLIENSFDASYQINAEAEKVYVLKPKLSLDIDVEEDKSKGRGRVLQY